MASVGSEEDDGAVPLDIDNVHMLLQVEHEQIQRRTFTNWINAQLSKRDPPSFVSDLFSDLRDGSRLLDLLEVMSGQTLKRQRGQGFFQQRENIESALDFLRKKNIKLVNINIPDIVDGRPSIVLGLVWTIILHCHIEELANALSFSSRHSSLDSLASRDSWSGSPVPVSPVPAGRTSPLHRRFRVSAKKALLMWVRDQCQKVGSSVSVRDFSSSWRSGEAFLAVLCSLRPRLVDLSLVQSRSNRQNLEEAFHLAERELHIPRLLEPQDVDVKDPDDKSIITYVAQFLQYSNDMPAPDDHLQISASERAQEVSCWLQQTSQEATGNSGNTEKHQLQRCKADPDLGLPPPPLDSVVVWLQRVEAALMEEGARRWKDPADVAREARAQQDALQTLLKEMNHHVKVLDDYHNVDGSGNVLVPPEKFEEIKRRVAHVRVTTKYHGIKLEYQEHRHTVLDLLNRVRAKIQTWTTSYRSKEAVLVLLQDWHETVERQDLLLILTDALLNLKEKADAYTGEAALGDDSQLVRRRVKEAEGEAAALARAVATARGSMERVASAWDTYDGCLASLQSWLARSPAVGTQGMSEWAECQAKLNEAGNFLIEVTDTSTGRALAGQLGKVNKHWAECVKRTKFEIPGSPGLKERVGEPVRRTQTRPETGSFVVASTRSAEKTETVTLQTQGPGQLSPRTRDPQGRPQHRHTNAQDGAPTIVVPLVKVQMLPRSLTEAVLHFHSPLESKPVTQPQSFSESHAQALRQKDQPSPSSVQIDVGPTSPKSLLLSKHVISSVGEEKESSPLSQSHKPKSSVRAQPINADETSPRPPVLVRGEVRSRARSMARSRLDKARVRLQGRIQQAMELFGSKEISESQAKRKQRSLKALQHVVLEEFLDALEGFGAFLSGPRLRELTLLSDSVRKCWEDVVDGDASTEERLESLRELSETVTAGQSSCPATEQPEETDEEQETRRGDTVLLQHRGRQLGVNAPLGATGTSSTDSDLPERLRVDVPQLEPSPADGSVTPPGDSLHLRSARDVPSDGKDSSQNRKPSLRGREQLLTARLLHMAESNEPTQTHIQAVIRSSTVETKQAAEWTVVPDAVDEQEEQRSGQEVLERCRTSFLVFQPQLQKIDQHLAMKDEMKPTGTEQTQRSEEFGPVQRCPTKTRDDSGTQERELLPPRGAEEEEEEESGLDGEHKSQTWESEGDVEDQSGGKRRRRVKKEEEEKESSVQRRDALFGALREMREAAEQLRLHELTLPALQQRTRALTELQSRHAGLLPELRRVRDDTSSPGHRSGKDVEGSWEETTKALNERLEQCCVLTELLKRFQSVRAELSGTLQKAESTIGEQASYMGKENLLRFHSKVQETKAELRGLGDGVEEVRGVCRQIHTHLRQMPECDVVPFESDADTLMDSWLDISERTDSRLENSHLCLTLWDGVLWLGAEVEKWSADKLAAFARSPRFQSDDDVRELKSEIVAQEENVEHFQRRATEIQTLLRSTERPLELQVAETQMRKKLEQLKEIVSEAEDVYEQTVAAKGQIAERIADCFESLRRVHDSLLALGGLEAATVLAKLKDLCRQLQAQDERAEGLLDDLRALSSVCGADALRSLSAEAARLRDELRNSQRLLSELQEQTQRDVRDLHSAMTELLGNPALSPQRGDLRRTALVERHLDFHGDQERRSSAGGDAVESWVRDPRRLGEDQRLHHARAEVSAAADREVRLEKLRVAGNGLTGGLCDGGNLKLDIQDSVHTTEEQQGILLQSAEPHHSVLQSDADIIDSYPDRRQTVRHRVGELQRQVTGLPASFPWPGAAERRQACRLARQLRDESESLQITLRRDLTERTGDHDVWKDSSWAELDDCCSSLMAELKDACSRLEDGASDEEHFGQLLQDCHRKLTSLQDRTSACRGQRDGSGGPLTDVPALEALLHEVTDLEKDILQLETLKDSVADSSTVVAQANLSQQVGNLQSHKRALDGSIRGNLVSLAAHGNPRRVQQVREEVCCVRTAVRALADDVGNLFAKQEALADASLITQQWSGIQDFDSRLTDLAARVCGLQKIAESGTTPEMLPADVLLTVDGVAKDFDSLRSFFLQNKQECAENTACGVRGVIAELQRWSQTTVRAQPSQETRGHGHVELDKKETAGETFISDASYSASRDETPDTCPPESPSSSATDQEHLDSVQNDNKVITKGSCLSSSPTEITSGYLTGQSNTSQGVADAQDVKNRCENIGVTPKKVFTIVLEMEPHHMQDSGHVRSSDTPLNSQGAELCGAKLTEVDSQNVEAQSETREKDTSTSPNKVFTIVLDVELPLCQDVRHRESSEASRCSQGAELCDAKPTGVSKSDLLATLIAPEVDETNLKGHKSKVADSLSEGADRVIAISSSVLMSTELELSETHDLMPDVPLNSPKACGGVAERQLPGAHAGETTFLRVEEELTDPFHSDERTVSSVLCTAESPVLTGDAFDNSDTHIPAGDDDEHTMGAADAGEGREELAAESKHSEGPERRDDNTSLPKEGSESEFPASLEDTEVTRGQPQMREGMETERTAPGSSADPGPADGTMSTSHQQGSTMQDIFSEIQSLVERSNIINRTPHIDLNWYLKSSLGEQEIRLVRTVQRVLACRYQPAQLDVTAMAQQLEEAEGHRSCVQEQVATMKSASAAKGCDPNALLRAEGQWKAALLDASATVQVKAAQLDQVKQFHHQMKLTRAFLEVLAAEREKMSLNALGSSAAQADKLQALLQTMEQKKSIMEELLHLSSQMSVHLSYAESSGALLAQLGDVQEQWRLLEASVKRALRHATNSTSQSSVLVKDAEQLRAKLEDLQSSNFDNNDGKSDLEFVCATTDLKLYQQLYLHLQSQSEALVHFSLGQKEKDEVRDRLQELWLLLDVTKTKLHDSTCGCGDVSSAKINKQLKDLIVWAKQAENHISTGKKLALFPEEARVQIADMKKFQTGILSRRSKMRGQVEGMKGVASDMEKEESDQVLKTIEDLYEAIADSLDHVLDTMKKHLQKREKLLSQLASMDDWLAQSHATRDAFAHVENVSKADVQKLESELRSHKLAAVEIRSQLKLVEAMAEGSKDIAVGLSPGESRYLVNRLSGLWTELDGLLAHENATSWELEELIHERKSSDEELSIIQTSLEKISADLEQQRFPSTQETLSTVARVTHVLVENRCQAQELQHCDEAKRSALLHSVGELQDRCKALSLGAFEQDKYLHLRRQMEESRDVAKEQMRRAREKSVSVGERFRLCQTLLVELPLVKTQCQEAGDQLEALAQELYPSQLHAERQRIRHVVETLVSLEQSVADDVKDLEAKLLLGLRFSSELPALTELFRRARAELQGAEPVDPDERAIDGALRSCWVAWRNMESGMRVLEALGRKQKVNVKDCEELHALRDAAMQECHLGMESLSQARESLKDYQWAAQGAIAFLHNADATFLSAPGGFLDCTEEQRQTRRALGALEEGFQAHICHLVELLPQQPCLSRGKVEELHIGILSRLLVGRAVLEAQAQLRLESLQRCAVRQQSHRSCHEDVRQRLSGFEDRLSECAAVQVTAYDKCVAQQERARLLMDDLCSLAGQIEDLRAACPMQGCAVGKDGELGALWRRWVALRRGVGLLMAHAEQRREEWKDITASMQQCCSFLASLQAEVPGSSTVSFTQEIPQELLAQAEIHQAGLEQEQQDLASLEHRLEHALSLSHSLDPVGPGPVGKTLVKIQENVRSLKERNLMIVAAAQAEEKEREQVLEEIDGVEKHVFALVPKLEACWNRSQGQELRKALSSQKAKLENILDGVQSRYAEVPADIGKRLQEVQRRVDELVERSDPVRKLAGRGVELGSGLGKVMALLEQKSPTVGEAQNVLKRVWDELDTWHSRLMLLESEMQDLAEEQPDQAHVLMDHIARPLQLHQNASQMAEYRTALLSKIPACLRQFEDISHSATCWLEEAQSWLSAPCSFTTARSLQNHANSLQLVLDDSERIRDMLQDFRPVLAEISAVCDVGSQEETLDQSDQRVHQMQRNLLEPLEQLLQAVVVVESMEAEVKTIEKNVPKIRAILSSVDDSNITLTEHLHNREVILANVQSIRTTLEEMERCKAELLLPRGAEESLLVFSRARLLLQPLEELGKLTQYQTSLLQNKIGMEEETRKDLGLTTASDRPEERQQQVQEPCEVSNSEEEEEEEDGESCHSSSSDTLTCSVPEDPEETLVTSDLESEDVADGKSLPNVKEPKSSTHQFSPEVETGSKRSESSDSNDFASKSDETGLRAMDSKADVAFHSSRPQRLIVEVPPADGDALDRRELAKQETSDALDPRSKPPQAAAAVEETRLVPVRPVAPFTSTRDSHEFVREDDNDDGDLTSSTAPHPDVETLSKEQCEAGAGHDAVDESQQAQESSKGSSSLLAHEGDETKQQRWSRLYARISDKLTTLKIVEEQHRTPTRSEDGGDHEEVPEKQLISTGSAPAVLQRTRESVALLRQIVKSADASRPDVRGEGEEEGEGLYEALRSVLLCLDAWTDRPDAEGEDEPQLRLLQQECVSAELATVAELLNKVESDTEEDPDARQCLTRLRDCVRTVQPLFTSSHNQLAERLGLEHQHQFHNQLSLLDEFDLGQCETFQGLKDAPNLERCVLGRHLRESPGEEAELRRASRASLQGITHLLELAEGDIKERQASQLHGRGQLQAALCRHQKLLWVLGSQLAFAQHLIFRREPETPERLEDEERLQRLEVRARALQQQALGREAASQRRLQEWTLWEDRCCQLGRVLDESEALISSGEAQGDDDDDEEEEELVVQRRLEACQRTLGRLDESRAALGLMLDQRELLRTEPTFAASVGQTGGALELRWRSACRRTEQEVQRCRDIQVVRARFQTHFSSVSNWLLGADERLKSWSDANGERDPNGLIELLDFSMETEAMSVRRASVSRDATRLLHLWEADRPGLRAQVAQLEVNWSRHTSGLSRTQEQLHQRLLARWPPAELLSDLEAWLKKQEASLSREEEKLLEAEDASQISEVLQRCRELKAGVVSGQLLVDFLCQSRPQAAGADVLTLQSERTLFAETLGDLRLRWLHLQGTLESQIRGAEQTHRTCAVRERRLQHLRGWVARQKEQLSRWEQPTSQTLARQALREWEDVVGGGKEVAAALQRSKAAKEEDERPRDVAFSSQAGSVSLDYEDLSQQMEALRPTLQHTVEQWSRFHGDLREVSLRAGELRRALQHRRAPLFSLGQAEGHVERLQELEGKAEKGEELWAAVEKSFRSLVKTLHCGAARAVGDQVDGELRRWKDARRELKDEQAKAVETVSLWREHRRLSEDSSLHLRRLWLQWEELLRSRDRDTRAAVQSVEALQGVADSLKSGVSDALEASERLIGRLVPLAGNLIQSEVGFLSRDVLLLSRAMAAKRKSLQDDLEDQKLFHTCLQSLETQTQNIKEKLKEGSEDQDSEKVLLELGDLFPPLVDVRETSSYLTLDDRDTERLRALGGEWVEGVTRASDMSRRLQAERQRHQTVEEKCDHLTLLKEKLVEGSRKHESPSCLQEILTVQQRLQADVVAGHQLLQGLLCDAVESVGKETGERRSELVARVSSAREGWFGAVALAGRCRSAAKEQLRQRRIYNRGLRVLWKLLRDVDTLLPPAGPALCTPQQSRSCVDDYRCVEEALDLHSTVYDRTLEAGRRLCETTRESEGRSRLQSELRAVAEAWKGTASRLERRTDLLRATAQKWSRCQEGITSLASDLDKVKSRMLERPEDSEKLPQETELSLQRLAGGLRELGTMKTDLSQHITAGDSALLEQQLEQLHGQWEELCMKVSLRKQEIADRLNAWTIFNDKNKEFCDWLAQMENKVGHSNDLSIEEMVEKLKKDCMEEINLFSENKCHLKQLGEQLLQASDEAKQTRVRGSLQEVNQRWHNLFHHIEARVKKLKETLVTLQQLDKNMSNLRSWLSRIEAELSRPITYSVCHHQEIQRRLAEQQELQRDIEQHTEGVASVLSLCDVLLRDEDAVAAATGFGGDATEVESDSLQDTSRSLDQRWRTICTLALDRRLRIEETWRLWCKFLDDYSRFEDWLTSAERTAANPNSAGVLYTAAKEELKKFEGFQRQVHERLTQLELVNNQYRRLARENRTDRASQLKAMVHEGNRRWDVLHRRVAAILRRLKYFTSQREEFEGTRENMLVWLTELDLQLTNVEHFSESDVHHKIQQLNSFQKEITLNTERIDGLIVFGEGLIQRSSPQDAALIEDELEELHTYCQEVFSRLVRFHQRLSQPPKIREEPELSGSAFSLESSLELIGRPWLGRGNFSLPATPTHLLASPLERSGRETPVSVDSLPLEWDHTGDVGGSSSHEDDDEDDDDDDEEEEEEEPEEEGVYFSALSVPSRSVVVGGSPVWDADTPPLLLRPDDHTEAEPTLTSTPRKKSYLGLMSQCSGNIEDIKRVSLILDDDDDVEQQQLGLTGLSTSDKQSGVIERWELLQAQARAPQQDGPQGPERLRSELDGLASWLEDVIPELERLQRSNPGASVADMEARARELKEMQRMFAHHKSTMLSVNLRAPDAPELQSRLTGANRDWSRVCTGLQRWDAGLRKTLLRCREFHQTLHSLLLWLAHAESRRYAVDIGHRDTPLRALRQHRDTLAGLREELRGRQAQQASLQALWSQLRPEDDEGEGGEESDEAQEKLHVTGSKLKRLLRDVDQDLGGLRLRLTGESAADVVVGNQSVSADGSHDDAQKKGSSVPREKRGSSSSSSSSPPPRSFFQRVLRAAFPLHLLLLLVLLLPCLIPLSDGDPGCSVANNFASSFSPMLHYTNGPPPT